jgi:hypothetical protein
MPLFNLPLVNVIPFPSCLISLIARVTNYVNVTQILDKFITITTFLNTPEIGWRVL